VDLWNINKVKDMFVIFDGATALTSCNKRKIANAWKSSAAFTATTYDTSWATVTCQESVSTDYCCFVSVQGSLPVESHVCLNLTFIR
jgi:hypothetical protein